MKKCISVIIALVLISGWLQAQVEPGAGTWKTWFISSASAYRLPAPPSYKEEIDAVLTRQQKLDAAAMEQIVFWNSGSPGYRWQEMISKIFVVQGVNGIMANMLLGAATYDATIAAWDTKYTYKKPRPFAADKRIKVFGLKPESPSYPCEHSVAAGVAVAVFSHFFPSLADSANRMAQRLMDSRISAGMAFPSDTRAGFELGKKIAEAEIANTKDFIPKTTWDGNVPQGPAYWRGKQPMQPMAGNSKTVVLASGSQYRPPAPPDFAKEMTELKNFKQTFSSQSNAYRYASTNPGSDLIATKIFEQNLHLNPPRAARIYAAAAIGLYDGFVACWDAKYAYWGIRPDQYDTTYKPLIPTPPFPGYPSGHATVGAVAAELLTYFFPADKALFQKTAKDGAESRFHAGIHFRTDNEVGVELGRKVGQAVVQRLKADGADDAPAWSANKQ